MRLDEAGRKFMQNMKLNRIFAQKSEFASVYPELIPLWKNKFRQMIRFSSERTFPIAEEFLQAHMDKKSNRNFNSKDNHEPILICALKNDLDKMHAFMNHYRALGVRQFVFLDNASTDGTQEFLLQQEDAEVYICYNAFTADRKIAWVNRLIAEYGMHRWYLMVDSDEFFSFLGCEKYSLEDFLSKAIERNCKRIGVIHLDMYPKGKLFNANANVDFLRDYCYFDKDTYVYSKAYNGIKIVGGPRKRIFGTNMKISGVRWVYFEEDDIVPSAHFMIPYSRKEIPSVYLVSRHFKFVNESDYEKMLEAVQTGMHSNNSEEYKTYYKVISENPDISLYDEAHSLAFNEDNLRVFPFLETPFENL